MNIRLYTPRYDIAFVIKLNRGTSNMKGSDQLKGSSMYSVDQNYKKRRSKRQLCLIGCGGIVWGTYGTI